VANKKRRQKQLLTYWAISSIIRDPGYFNTLSEDDMQDVSLTLKKLSRVHWIKLHQASVKLSAHFEEKKYKLIKGKAHD
tara:strand:- start:6283 stop:6519 length:237 start_codon:yes stop_codon:yes gene_type:complete